MARTSHVVVAAINGGGIGTPLRACRAWRISPMAGSERIHTPYVTGVLPVTVRLTDIGGGALAQAVTVDNDGWQTVPTGQGWGIESVSRAAIESRLGYIDSDPVTGDVAAAYLVECVDDLAECGQVNTRESVIQLPAAVTLSKRINGPTANPGLGVLAGCYGPAWATRLAIVLKGVVPAPPAFRLANDVIDLAADFDTAAPASLPAEILMGHPSPAATTGRVLAGSTAIPPGRLVQLVNLGAWAFAGGQFVDVVFRWSR